MAGKGASNVPVVRCPALDASGQPHGQTTPLDRVARERWSHCPYHATQLAYEHGEIALTSRLRLVADVDPHQGRDEPNV